MDYSSKTIVDKMKHKMKKQFKKIEEKMEDYEKYKTNYEYFKYSPYVQELLCEIADLKRVNKVLMNQLTIKHKSDYEINKVRKHKPVIIKVEPIPGNGEVIDLTHEDDSTNIVYDLEEVEDEDDVIDLTQDDVEDQDEEEDAVETEDQDAVETEAEEDQDAVETEDQDAEEDAEDQDEEEDEDQEEEDEEEADDQEEEEADEEQDAVETDDQEEEEADEEQDAVETEAEDDQAEAEEEEVYEVKIKNKTYYTTNEKNGTIYSVDKDGDIGDEVGQYVDGKPVFKK
jgi:hypothetical protein